MNKSEIISSYEQGEQNPENKKGNAQLFLGIISGGITGIIVFMILTLKDILEYRLYMDFYIKSLSSGKMDTFMMLASLKVILITIFVIILIPVFSFFMNRVPGAKIKTKKIYLLSLAGIIFFAFLNMPSYFKNFTARGVSFSLIDKIQIFFMSLLPRGIGNIMELLIVFMVLLLMKGIHKKIYGKESVFSTVFFIIVTAKLYFIRYYLFNIFTVWENSRAEVKSMKMIQALEYFLFQIKTDKEYRNSIVFNYIFFFTLILILFFGIFIISEQRKKSEKIF